MMQECCCISKLYQQRMNHDDYKAIIRHLSLYFWIDVSSKYVIFIRSGCNYPTPLWTKSWHKRTLCKHQQSRLLKSSSVHLRNIESWTICRTSIDCKYRWRVKHQCSINTWTSTMDTRRAQITRGYVDHNHRRNVAQSYHSCRTN